MIIKTGNIPEKVTYVYDDKLSAFVLDNESKVYSFNVNRENNRKILVCKNESLRNVKINNYSGKDNYSATVSVTGTDIVLNMSVDIHCDNVAEAMSEKGINKGGILNGEFVWATVDNRVKLLLRNSKTYNKIKTYMDSKDKKPIEIKDMEVGDIYLDRQDNRHLLIGFVDTIKYDFKTHIENRDRKYNFFRKDIANGLLLAQIHNNVRDDKIQYYLDNFNKHNIFDPFKFYIKTSHSLISKVTKVNVAEKFIENLKEMYIKGVSLSYTETTIPACNHRNYSRYCKVSGLVHMNPAGTGNDKTLLPVYNSIQGEINS